MWEGYVDVSPSVPINEILMSYELGKLLSEGKTSDFVTFCLRCREFIDRLIVMLLKTTSATSAISKGLYSFCPELMLKGDDNTAFRLYAGLWKVLETCGVIGFDVSKAAVEKYTSYRVERPKNHWSSWPSVSGITGVVQHLLLDFGFRARHRVFRVYLNVAVYLLSNILSLSLILDVVLWSLVLPRTVYVLFNHTLCVRDFHLKFFSVIRL